ncbi:MAG: hypothetical protein WAX68_09770 [Streptococcus suis]
MFKHIKLTTASSSWNTCINPNMSDEEIEKYFLNKFFDVGSDEVEKIVFPIAVSFEGLDYINNSLRWFLKKGVISYYDYSGLYKLTKKKKYLLKVKSLGKILDNGLKIKTQRFEVLWYGVGVTVTWKNNHIAPAHFTEKEFYTLGSID